ncbi:MAG: hypothetical protein ABJA60_11825 [Nitrosospira sp.]
MTKLRNNKASQMDIYRIFHTRHHRWLQWQQVTCTGFGTIAGPMPEEPVNQ